MRRFYTNLRSATKQRRVVARAQHEEWEKFIIAKLQEPPVRNRFAPNKPVGYDTGYRMKG